MPYRAPSTSSASASSRSLSLSRSHSHSRGPPLVPLFAQLTFYLVPAKLDIQLVDAQIAALGGERVGRMQDARVVVTALRGRPRIERVLGVGATKLTNLVSPAYISDAYTAASEGSTRLAPRDAYRIFPTQARTRTQSPSVEIVEPEPREKRGWESSVEILEVEPARARKRPRLSEPEDPKTPGEDTIPDVKEYDEDLRLSDMPRMCVQRACPLICPNQDIIDAIRPIYTYREFDEADQKNSNVLSYRRSVSMLKSVPRRLKSGAEARKLMDVGDKVAQRIDEYLSTGLIAESASIESSARFQTLQSFASIYSIGTSTAVELWNAGCRSLTDVRAYYCRSEEKEKEQLLEPTLTPRDARREERKAAKRRAGGNMSRSEVVGTWLDLKADLDAAIPRLEAEEIAHCVMQNVDALQPGCEWTIAGGYRRGKPAAGDVDVIVSPPPGTDFKHLIKALCARMATLGIITHVLHITTHDPTNPLHSHGANFDNLDKAFVILRLPERERCASAGGASALDVADGTYRTPPPAVPSSSTFASDPSASDPSVPASARTATPPPPPPPPPRLHRRVDIILAPRERYPAAVLSWSGSMMYERDLRRVAEIKGYKFRAGLIHLTSGREVNLGSEREILGFLGLPFVPPELRNAE